MSLRRSSRVSRQDARPQGLPGRHKFTSRSCPAGSPNVNGHTFVVPGLLVAYPAWRVIALPLLARLYVREVDLPGIDPKHRPPFRIEPELAVELLRWAGPRLGPLGKPLWVVTYGA
jgi:hypothetical protein